MAFVDFQSIATATSAMRKYQGYKFPSIQAYDRDAPPGDYGYDGDDQSEQTPLDHGIEERGLMIDYDKDPRSKRNREYERNIRKETAQESQTLTEILCRVCGAWCLKLKLPPEMKFTDLPKVRPNLIDGIEDCTR